MSVINRYRTTLAVALLLLAISAGGIFAYFADRSDSEVQEVLDLGKQAFDPNSGLSIEERAEIGKQLHEKVQDMPEEQKEKLRDQGREQFAKMFLERHIKEVERAEKYFEITDKDEKIKAIDTHIDDMEAEFQGYRRMFGMMRGFMGGGQSKGGEGRTTSENPPADRPRDEAGKNRMFKPPTEEEREKFQQQMLDSTTAEQRAKHTEYMRQMDARRIERGMPSLKDIRGNFGRGSR